MASDLFSTKFNAWWVLSAALLALVLVGGVLIGIFVGRDQEEQNNTNSQPPASEATAPQENTGGACGVPTDDQSYPTEAPETKWELYENVATIPTSQEYGPTKRDGNYWHCFAQSPKGALFAALSLSVAFTTGEVYEAGVDTPEAKDFFESQQELGSDFVFPEVAGYQIESYSESKATVKMLMNTGSVEGVATIDLVWDEAADDWKWDTSNSLAIEAAGDTDSFTKWSPQNG